MGGKGYKGKWVWIQKTNARDPHGDGNAPYLDGIDVSILPAVTLYQSAGGAAAGETE